MPRAGRKSEERRRPAPTARSGASKHAAARRPGPSCATPQPWAAYFYLCGDHPGVESAIEANLAQIVRAGASPSLPIAVQHDRSSGARRLVCPEPGAAPEFEAIGVANTGDPRALAGFLRWAWRSCPAEHLALVIGGMGIFDPFGAHGQEADRERWTHLFSLCDDRSSADALDVSELGHALREFVTEPRGGRPLDLVVFDVCEVAFIELAFELEGAVEILVSPQTDIPAEGLDYERLIGTWKTEIESQGGGSRGRELALATLGVARDAYVSSQSAIPVAVSALDLTRLGEVTAAFDAFTIAMAQYLGEELVWRVREQVRALDSLIVPHLETQSPAQSLRSGSVIVYDLHALVEAVAAVARETAELAAVCWLEQKVLDARRTVRRHSRWLRDLADALREEVRNGGARPDESDEIAPGIPLGEVTSFLGSPEVPGEGEGLWRLIDAPPLSRDANAGSSLPSLDPRTWSDASRVRGRRLEEILGRTVKRALPQLPADLAEEWGLLDLRRSQVRRIGKVAARVGEVLAQRGDAFVIGVERGPGSAGCGGVSIYRPGDLDALRDLTYLALRFHQHVHWAVYLAAVNLIKTHPLALWRVMSALLSTSSPTARAEALRLLVGPESQMLGFRQQLRALAPATSVQLTLDQRSEPRRGADSRSFYVLRLESNRPGATTIEQRSRVQEETIRSIQAELEQLLKQPSLRAADLDRFEALGRTLGEDVVQELDDSLARLIRDQAEELGGATDAVEPVHLQLQLPRELIGHPWELLHDGKGWFGERFAIARSVFMGVGVARRVPSRGADPVRVLLVGDPLLDGARARQLPGAREETIQIAEELERLAPTLDGVLDFVPERDVRVHERVSPVDLRQLLRGGGYDIVHFSGHAHFDPQDPEASAWLLSGGRLTALEIRNTLRSNSRPPWLVYANACSAGRDSPAEPPRYQREVFGLATAFVNSGVAAYVGPLWPIDDGMAAMIAVDFYRALLRERRTLGFALWRAKREARGLVYADDLGERELGARAGLGWASLALYGDPTASLAQLLGPRPRPAARAPAPERQPAPSPLRPAPPRSRPMRSVGAALDQLSGPGMKFLGVSREAPSVAAADRSPVLELVEEEGVRFWRVHGADREARLPGSEFSLAQAKAMRGERLSRWRAAPSVLGRWALAALERLAEGYDCAAVAREGLTRVSDRRGGLVPFSPPSASDRPFDRALVLCHGTFSSSASLAAGLAGSFLTWALRHYDAVLGFDHWTLSRDPVENAALLGTSLAPAGRSLARSIDLLVHSRGGLVARAFAELPVADAKVAREALRRVVFVATPHAGTQLATPRRWATAADLLVNLLPLDGSGLLGKLAGLLAQVVARGLIGAIPGLEAMDASSTGAGTLVGRLTASGGPPSGVRYAAVAIDHEAAPLLRGMLSRSGLAGLDAAADAFFAMANDLVVDTRSAWSLHAAPAPLGLALEPSRLLLVHGGAPPADTPAGARLLELAAVHHTNVLGSEPVRRFVEEALVGLA
jgi:CHAT domain-containing protein